MKKSIFLIPTTLLLLLLIIPLLPHKAYAQEPSGPVIDSMDIPNDVLDQLDLTDAERVVRVFDNTGFLWGLGEDNLSIEAFMQATLDSEFSKEYFWVMTTDEIVRTYTDKGELGLQKDDEKTTSENADCYKELPDEMENLTIIRRVAKDIVVNKLYVLMQGDRLFLGWSIYYDTNYGPYVYYSSIYTDYLMPLEVFRQLAKDFTDSDTPYTPMPGVENIPDLEQKYGRYNLHSENFSLKPPVPAIVWAAVAIVPIAAAVSLGWWITKRKTKRVTHISENTDV